MEQTALRFAFTNTVALSHLACGHLSTNGKTELLPHWEAVRFFMYDERYGVRRRTVGTISSCAGRWFGVWSRSTIGCFGISERPARRSPVPFAQIQRTVQQTFLLRSGRIAAADRVFRSSADTSFHNGAKNVTAMGTTLCLRRFAAPGSPPDWASPAVRPFWW